MPCLSPVRAPVPSSSFQRRSSSPLSSLRLWVFILSGPTSVQRCCSVSRPRACPLSAPSPSVRSQCCGCGYRPRRDARVGLSPTSSCLHSISACRPCVLHTCCTLRLLRQSLPRSPWNLLWGLWADPCHRGLNVSVLFTRLFSLHVRRDDLIDSGSSRICEILQQDF